MTTVPDLRPEHRLLCHCARRRVPEPVPIVESPIDWPFLLALAERHAVLALLAHSLRNARPDAPGVVLTSLDERFLQVTAQNLSRVSQLADLLDRLASYGVAAASFKGPILAAHFYGHLGARSSSDLDILVPPRSAARVRRLMLADGYSLPPRPRHRSGSLLHGIYRPAGRDDTYLPPAADLASVDVHVAFAFWKQGIRLEVPELLERCGAVTLAGRAINTLATEDLLLILAIHGMMHGWSTLRAVSDIDALAWSIRDWDAVVRRAATARMLRVLFVALLLARTLLGTDLPGEIVAVAGRDEETTRLAAHAAGELFHRSESEEWDPRPWHISFLDGPRDRIRFHARDLVYEWFLKWPWESWLGRRRAGRGVEATPGANTRTAS